MIGNKLLALLPVPGSALAAKFSGPYEICDQLSDTDCVTRTPYTEKKSCVCCINVLIPYHGRGRCIQEVSSSLLQPNSIRKKEATSVDQMEVV